MASMVFQQSWRWTSNDALEKVFYRARINVWSDDSEKKRAARSYIMTFVNVAHLVLSAAQANTQRTHWQYLVSRTYREWTGESVSC